METETQIERSASVTIVGKRPNDHDWQLFYPKVVTFNMVEIRHLTKGGPETLTLGLHELDSFIAWLHKARDSLTKEIEARSDYVDHKLA